jgi:hypothetical protein
MKKAKPFDAFASPSREPGERNTLDVLAWWLFSAGVLGMFFITLRALLSESDGDFRSWDEIRWQVKQLWGTGFLGAGGPMVVWLIQWTLKRRERPDRPIDDNTLE